MTDTSETTSAKVLRMVDLATGSAAKLLARFDIVLEISSDDRDIPASFWGDEEAGVRGQVVYVRGDTPVHSLLHETCHVICMDQRRRAVLDRDAGGTDIEESAVCYLQILLADHLEGVGRERLMDDMDAWGYSFRLGKTRDWFETDADDARRWLLEQRLINATGVPGWRLRTD